MFDYLEASEQPRLNHKSIKFFKIRWWRISRLNFSSPYIMGRLTIGSILNYLLTMTTWTLASLIINSSLVLTFPWTNLNRFSLVDWSHTCAAYRSCAYSWSNTWCGVSVRQNARTWSQQVGNSRITTGGYCTKTLQSPTHSGIETERTSSTFTLHWVVVEWV